LNLLSQLYLPLWESNSQPNLKNLKLLESIQFPPHLVLTPHWGEFKRLFPNIAHDQSDRFTQLKTALDKLAPLHQKSITIVLKGARTLIGSVCHGSEPSPLSPRLWVNPESTPALARGGTGDVLAGMIGGLIAQGMTPKDAAIQSTVWHAQTAIYLTQLYTERGVTPLSLVEYLLPFLQNFSPNSPPNQSVNLLRTH
jgi:NAD(P)H-hydrate epimerase